MRFPAVILACLATHAPAADPPRIVAVPPVDAGRGLVRVSETEIRHYPGKGGTHFLRSTDNGETWQTIKLPDGYPDATCMAKEAPSITRNTTTNLVDRHLKPLFLR